MRSLLIGAVIWVLFSQLAHATSRYDRWFEDYTILHFGFEVSPRWVKAVAMAESNLKPEAVSWVGAQGLMQFMPGTWEWQARGLWKGRGAFDPESAIFVGCKYLRWIYNRLKSVPCKEEKKAMTNAGYNSGPGNIDKARKRCRGDALLCSDEIWTANVERSLVTNPRAQEETKSYVRRIRRFEKALRERGE